jgi:hypothetical protein
MRRLIPKFAVIAGVVLIAFVSYSFGSRKPATGASDQLKVDILTLPKAQGNNPDVPRIVRDYSKLTPPAHQVLFALVSFSNGSTLVVPQGGLRTSEEVGQDENNVFVLRGNILTLTGTVNINSVVAVYR